MRKNFYLKEIMSALILMAISLTMVSCQGLIDAVLGSADVPLTTNQEEVAVSPVTITTKGATVSVDSPSDITKALDQLKSDIASKGVEKYEVSITNTSIETTSSDNTISVPKVVGSNVNINFDNAVKSSTPLVVKASETASAESTTAVNNLTITMPNVDETNAIDLELNMPETTVTLKTSGTQTVYDYVIAKTAQNTLIIDKGVKIRELQVDGGTVVVMDGGIIETYVYTTGKENYAGEVSMGYENTKYFVNHTEEGVESVMIEIKKESDDAESPTECEHIYEIANESGDAYYMDNLKVIKPKKENGDENVDVINYVVVSDDENQSGIPLNQLTIGDNVVVKWRNGKLNILDSNSGAEGPVSIDIYSIIGEGNATFQYGEITSQNGLTSYVNSYSFTNVKSMRNVTFEPIWEKGERHYIRSRLYNIHDAIYCIFNARYFHFDEFISNPNTIYGCTFVYGGTNVEDRIWPSIYIDLPPQSHNLVSSKLSFEECTFNETRFIMMAGNGTPLYDMSNDQVYKDTYYWWGDDGLIRHSLSFDDVPESERVYDATGKSEFWHYGYQAGTYGVIKNQPQILDSRYNGYISRFSFKNCVYNNGYFNETLKIITGYYNGSIFVPIGSDIFFNINGTDYRFGNRDSETGLFSFIKAE